MYRVPITHDRLSDLDDCPLTLEPQRSLIHSLPISDLRFNIEFHSDSRPFPRHLRGRLFLQRRLVGSVHDIGE